MQAAFGELKRFNLVVGDYFESVTLTSGVSRIDVPFRSFASRSAISWSTSGSAR